MGGPMSVDAVGNLNLRTCESCEERRQCLCHCENTTLGAQQSDCARLRSTRLAPKSLDVASNVHPDCSPSRGHRPITPMAQGRLSLSPILPGNTAPFKADEKESNVRTSYIKRQQITLIIIAISPISLPLNASKMRSNLRSLFTMGEPQSIR